MSQAFYRKWRPQTWDEVVSQEHVVQTLRNAVRTGRIGHAYLLAGPRGTGKTTTARLLAKALNCQSADLAARPCDECEHCKSVNEGRYMDLVEIDAASNTSVDDVRDLREKINFRPSQGEYKVYIIDEVHMLSTAAFNALLKTLEEPPPHAIFILATTEVHKIPATVLSRCQRYEFRRIPVPEIVKHLRAIAAEEGLQVDDDALLLIARQATGAMRDAISLLDQLASTGERVTLAEAQVVLGTATSGMVVELVEAVLARDAGRGMGLIQTTLDAGADARQFARQVVDYLRGLLLVRMGNADQVDATPEMRAQLAQHAGRFEQAALLECIRLFNNAATDARSSWHPGLALELAFAESIEEKALRPAVEDAAAAPIGRAAEPAAARPAASTPASAPAGKPAQSGGRSEGGRSEGGRSEGGRSEGERSGAERMAGALSISAAAEAAKPQAAEKSQAAAEGSQPGAAKPQAAAERSQPGAAKPQAEAGKTQPGAGKRQPAAPEMPEEPPFDEPPADEPGFYSELTYEDLPAVPPPAQAGKGQAQKPVQQPGTPPQTQPAAQRGGAGAGPTGQPKPAQPKPAQNEPPAQPAKPAAGGKTVSQQEVQQNWTRVRAFVKARNRMTEGLLNSGRYALKENTLVLSFTSEVVKSKMDTAENLELLRQALQNVLGAALNVRCVLSGSKTTAPDDVAGDSMVGTALDLGGKIVYEE